MLLKCLCDQLFFATQQDFVFLLLCAYSDSKQLPQAIEEVKRTFLPTWLMDCSLWPVVNFVGFAMVPYTLQPTYMACVQFFWQIYLSSVAAKEEAAAKSHGALSAVNKSVHSTRSDLLSSATLAPISSLPNEDPMQICKDCLFRDIQQTVVRVESDVFRKYVFNALRSTSLPDFSSSNLLASRSHDMPLKSSARTALKRYSKFRSYSSSGANFSMQDVRFEAEVNTALKSSGFGLSLLAVTAATRNLLYKI